MPGFIQSTRTLLLLSFLFIGTLVGCDFASEAEQPPALNAPDEPQALLPETGVSFFPSLATVKSTIADEDASTVLSAEERTALIGTLETVQRMQGTEYVAVISQQNPNGTYRYRYRSLTPTRPLLEAAQGRLAFYAYQFKTEEGRAPTRFLAAFIPDTPEAIAKMDQWVRYREQASSTQAAGKGIAFSGPANPFGQASSPIADLAQASKSAQACEFSEVFVFVEECGCFGYEKLEVCATGGGDGGGEDDPGEEWPSGDGNGCSNPFGCDDNTGGGSSDGGGGSGDGECDESAIDCNTEGPGDIASKADLSVIFAACGVTSDETQPHAFSNSIRKNLGMSYRPQSQGELDGYKVESYFGHSVIT